MESSISFIFSSDLKSKFSLLPIYIISSTIRCRPLSPKFKRKRAGRKGIGRFSAQRLGEKLTIITQTSYSKNAYKVNIDWNSYKMDEDLMLISNSIEEIPRERAIANGTTLIIEGLRDWWSEAMIKRVYRYALDIVQPFPLAKQKLIDGKIEDVGFQINCLKDDVPIANEESMFFEHALAEIEGGVDEEGRAYWQIINSKVDSITETKQFLEENRKMKKCGKREFCANCSKI